jgi:hypothetical protein
MTRTKRQLFLYPAEVRTLDAIRSGRYADASPGAATNLHMIGRVTADDLASVQSTQI